MLIAFLATFFLLFGLGVALIVNKKMFKRLGEKDFSDALNRLVDGRITSNEWLVFLSLPLKHDPWLEELKMELLELCEEFDVRHVTSEQFPMFLMEDEGIQRAKDILDKLTKRPYKEF